MSEIRRQDIWSDDLIQAPLVYTKNLEKTIQTTNKLIKLMKNSQTNIQQAESIRAVARETSKLSTAEKELQSLQQNISKATVRQTSAYQNQSKQLIALREIQRTRNQQAKQEAIISNSIGGAYKRLSVQLDLARKKYKDLAASGKASTRTLQEQQKVVQQLDTKVKAIDKSAGQFQRNVGNYPGTFNAAAGSVKNLLAAFGVVGGLVLFARLMRSVVDLTRQYERQNSTLQAVLGATSKEMKQLRLTQLELGKSTEFTSTQVAELQTEFARLGFPTRDIQNMTASTLDAALAMGANLGEQAKLTGATLKAFKLDSDQATRVNDVLAKSTSSSALSFEKLNTAMSVVAPVANKFGFSVEETTALLGELSNAGFDASSAATATRNIMLNLADANGALAKRLKEPVKDLPSLVQGLNQLKSEGIDLGEALELTDKRSVAAFATFLGGTDSVLKLNDELANAEGTAASMAQTMGDNLEGDVKKLQSAWEGLMLSITKGDTFFNSLLRTVTQLAAKLFGMLTPTEKISDALRDENKELNSLVRQYELYNDNADEQKRIIDELNKNHPKFLKGIKDENINFKTLETRLKAVNDQFQRRIALAVAEEKIQETEEEIFQVRESIRKSTEKQIELEQQLAKASDLNTSASGLSAKSSTELAISGQKGLQIQLQEKLNKLEQEQADQIEYHLQRLDEIAQVEDDYFEEVVENEEEVQETEQETHNQKIKNLEEQLTLARAAAIGQTMTAREQLNANKAIAKAERDLALAKTDNAAERELIEAQYLAKIGELNTKFYDEEAEKAREISEIKNEAFREGYEEDVKNQKEAEEKKRKEFENTIAQVQSITQSLNSSLVGIYNGLTERRIQNMEAELDALDRQTEKEIELAGENDEAKERIEARGEQRRLALENQIRREKQRAARINKAAALIDAAINTALSITKTLADLGIPAGIPASILAGALGTAQSAAIAAQPIPQFAKGTKSAKGGAAIVGEKGFELVKELSGRTYLTPDSPSLMNIPKGAEVVPHEETVRQLAASAVTNQTFVDTRQGMNIKELQRVIADGDSRVVDAIYKNGGHLERDGSILMKVTKDESGNRRRTRLKSMG